MPTTPNYKGRFLQGTDTNTKVGDRIEAGLPNITGDISPVKGLSGPISINNFPQGNGAFSKTKLNYGKDITDGSKEIWTSKVIFDASSSNPIYGNSSTVQPPAVVVKYIIKGE